MATLETSPAEIDDEALALTFKTQAAMDANNSGEYVNAVERMSSTFEQQGPMKNVAKLMKENAEGVKKALNGSTQVNVDATLESGLNGFTQVGGSDSTMTLNADLLVSTTYDTTQDLEETYMHEDRHNKQVQLQTGGQETILVTANGKNVQDPTLVFEADTENFTAEKFGQRDNQPPLYAEAYDIGQEVQQDHKEAWQETLTVTGDLSSLQGEIWEVGLNNGTLTMDDLIYQADVTGYQEMAAQVASVHIQNGGK